LAGFPIITGSMVLGLKDQLRAAYWSMPGLYHWAAAALVGLAIILTGLVPAPRPSSLLELILIVFIAAPLFAVGSVASFFLLLYRLTPAQRQVRYEIDTASLVTRDATGAAIALPWEQVLSARETNSGFVIKVRPAGSRWFAKRALSADAVAALRQLLKEKLGNAAQLRSQ
jgi:hypothetical protein